MAYSSVLRCLIVCFAFGALVSATKLQESKLLQGTTRHRLEKLKNELAELTKKSVKSDAKDDAEREIKNLLDAVKVTNRTASKTQVKVTNRTASKTKAEDLTALQELFEETDMTAAKQPVKVTNRTASKEPVKVTNRTASKTKTEDLTALQELFEETDMTAAKQPVKVTNRTASKEPVKVTNLSAVKAKGDENEDNEDGDDEEEEEEENEEEDDDDEDDDDDDDDDDISKLSVKVTNEKASKEPVKVTNRTASKEPVKVTNRTALKSKDDDDDHDDDEEDDEDGVDAFDGIYYFAAALADEIKAQCGIDIAAIFDTYRPATLKDVNDAQADLSTAAKKLAATLSASPGFADSLKNYLDSNEYSDANVADKVSKTIETMEKTLAIDHKQIFCVEARILANRLQMSLYGGVGFVNGYLCNKFSVELARYGNDAAQLLKAASEDDNLLKQFTSYLVDDIKCYEKELEAFQKVVPVNPFTGESPLQTAAFTSDFVLNYGVVLLYHRIIILTQAAIVEIWASGGDDVSDNDVDSDVDKSADDEKSLTNQLHKLLTKLQDVSAKKKAAEAALSNRAGSNMPVRGENAFLKSSHYKRRINN